MAAQISLRPPTDDTRASQLLPSITCSTCAQPISLDGLADHICSGSPPPSSSSSRTPPAAAATVNSSSNYSNSSSMAPKRLAPPQNQPLSIPRSSSPLRPNANSPPSTRPSFDQPRPSFDQSQARPSFDSQRPPQPPRSPYQEHAPMQPMQPQQPQQFTPAPSHDTKTGGTAGMAGVGRRGFAAAAAAAMFTVKHPQPHRKFVEADHPILNIPNSCKFLLFSTFFLETRNGSNADNPVASPPLDPRAPSPYSSHGHGSNQGHGSDHGHQQQAPLSVMSDPRQRRPSAAERPKLDMAPVRPNEIPVQESRSKLSPDDFAKSPPKLAYLDSTVSSKDFNFSPTRKDSDHGHEVTTPRGASNLGKAFDTPTSRDPVDFPKSQRRGSVTESFYSTSSRGNANEGGASLERSLSSPYESSSSPSLSQSTNPTSAASSADHHLKVAQLQQHPTRSNTSPSLSRPDKPPKDQPTTRRRSEKKCVKCGKKITDGKWVQVDSTDSSAPSVLCEYDWKMLYLPKCRRCDKPIEGQAVGSADGQIKGKYHRDCFNCTSCQVCVPSSWLPDQFQLKPLY